MRITELFTAQSIALDEALQTQEQILSRLVELQATHGNITDKEAYKKALYAREAEGSTYVDNGITVPHAKTNVVTRPSLAALRLSTPVQYNAEDDGKTDLLFAITTPSTRPLMLPTTPACPGGWTKPPCRRRRSSSWAPTIFWPCARRVLPPQPMATRCAPSPTAMSPGGATRSTLR
jgi:mannitol/fructose-specific phosphotransferase system IIA component (Ntr-type)